MAKTKTGRTRGKAGSKGRRNSIEAEGLVRIFKGDIRAVDGIDLHVSPGQIYGFLGPNGAGKSTTVHMLTTLLPPTSGRGSVAGFDIAKQANQVRSVAGAALQDVALDAHLTGREHMRLQAALHGIPRPTWGSRGQELLERIGLSEAADRKVGTYSGGMKRRLDLALALVHQPQVLFLDEPTTGLDPQSRAALWDEVRQLAHNEGVTVFLTTQYLEEADALADHVAIIDHGKIVADGTPARLKAEIGSRRIEVVPVKASDRRKLTKLMVEFGDLHPSKPDTVSIQLAPGQNGIDRVVRALDKAKIKVEDLSLHAPTLSDVFLEKTGRSLEGAAEEEVEA